MTTSIILILSLFVGALAMKNLVHATKDPLVFMLYFIADSSGIFTNSSGLNSMITTTFSCANGETISPTPTYYYITSDYKLAGLTLTTNLIPAGCNMQLQFPTGTSPSLDSTSITVQLQAYNSEVSSSIWTYTQINFYSGIASLAITLSEMILHPYSIVYMYSKMTIETLDTFKMADLNYEAFYFNYLESNNNKIAGIRVPNLFSEMIQGDSLDSGFSRDDSYISLTNRESDLKVASYDVVHFYTTFPLFLDNFGEELTVMCGLCVLAGIMHLIGNYTKDTPQVDIVNFFRVNILLATFCASVQNGLFYGIIQVLMLFNSYYEGHNFINFIFAACYLAALVGGIIFICLILGPLTDTTVIDRKWKGKYQVLYGVYETGANPPWLIVVIMIRNMIFSVALVIAGLSALYQTIIILVFSCLIIGLIIFYEVIKQRVAFYTVLLHEICILVYSVFMLLIAIDDKNIEYTSSTRNMYCDIMMYISTFLPILSCGCGVAGFIWGYQSSLIKSTTILPESQTERKGLDETSDRGINNSGKDSMMASVDQKRENEEKREENNSQNSEEDFKSPPEKKTEKKELKRSKTKEQKKKEEERPKEEEKQERESTLEVNSDWGNELFGDPIKKDDLWGGLSDLENDEGNVSSPRKTIDIPQPGPRKIADEVNHHFFQKSSTRGIEELNK